MKNLIKKLIKKIGYVIKKPDSEQVKATRDLQKNYYLCV